MLIIWVFFFICVFVILVVFLNFFFVIKCLNLCDLIIFVFLFINNGFIDLLYCSVFNLLILCFFFLWWLWGLRDVSVDFIVFICFGVVL